MPYQILTFLNKKWWLIFKAKKKFSKGTSLRPGRIVPLSLSRIDKSIDPLQWIRKDKIDKRIIIPIRNKHSKSDVLVCVDYTNALFFYGPQNVLEWSKFFVPIQRFIYILQVAVSNILCQTKRWFEFSKIGFCASTKVFEEAMN